MKIKVLVLVITCIGLLGACKKQIEPGRGTESDESGYYLKFRTQGQSYVWNEAGRNSPAYNFDAYFSKGSGNLLLNVSPGTAESGDPFSFNINVRTNKIVGDYTICPDGKNGNAFNFLYGSKTYTIRGGSKGAPYLKMFLEPIDGDAKIIKGSFNGIVTEIIKRKSGGTDSTLIAIDGSFRLRLSSLPDPPTEQKYNKKGPY